MDQNPPKESRPPINLRIKFRSETLDQFIERYAVDVSRGGIFIRTREPLAVGTQLKLDFQFQSGNPLMSGEGTVVWIRELDPNRTSVPPGMGVRFDKLTPDSQAVLEQLLSEKGKRERSGIPGSGVGGAGGMAVRRPSSLFAVLDPRAAAEASAAAAAAVAVAVAVAVKGSTFPANAAASEGAAAAPPISESARRDAANAKQDTPGYRPLGNARNPFSSASPSASASPSGGNDPGTPSHTEPVGSSPVTMKPLAGLASVAKPNTFPAHRRPTPVDNAAPFDDISDEPTQIAGRLPSFLTTDEEETAVVRPFAAAPFAGAQRSANAAGAKTEPAKTKPSPDQTATKTIASPAQAGEAAPPSKIAESVGDSEVARGTAPTPIALPRPVMPGMGASPLVTAEPVNVAGEAAAAGAPVAASATAAPAQPPATGSATPAVAPGKTAPAKPKTPAGEGATAKALLGGKATPAARPLPGTWIAGSVLVLGAALFFLVRFFSSNDEKPVSTRTTDSTIGASIGGPATVTPPAAEQNSGAAPSSAPNADPAAPTTLGAGPAPSDSPPAAPLPGTGAPTAADLADRTGRAEPKATPPPTTVTVSSAKPARRKAPHVASPRDVPREAALAGEPVAAAESKPVESPTTTAAAAAPAAAKPDVAVGSGGTPSTPPTSPPPPTSPADPTADAHQIRVTSKPIGADVVLDGIAVGRTPFTIGIADVNAPHAIAIRKDGFEPFEEMISASSGWIKGPKTSQGKPSAQILKINAKLKQIGGTTAGSGDGKLAAPPTSADPGGEGAKNEQRPLPSRADDRNTAEPTPP